MKTDREEQLERMLSKVLSCFTDEQIALLGSDIQIFLADQRKFDEARREMEIEQLRRLRAKYESCADALPVPS